LFVAPIHAVAADCNANGIEDAEDLSSGLSPDCNRNGAPDECDVADANGFPIHQLVSVPENLSSLVAVDLDGDSDLDVAVGGSRYLLVHRNDGRGKLSQPDVYEPEGGGGVGALAVGDFDGDGSLDLSTVAQGIHVFLANADGDLVVKSTQRSTKPAVSIVASDIDEDGDVDLAAAHFISDPSVSVYVNDGTAAFPSDSNFEVGGVPTWVEVADLDSDGDRDLAVCSQSAFLLDNLGSGTFDSPRLLSDLPLNRIVASNLNADARMDLAASSSPGSSLAVFLGSEGGGFAPPSAYPGSDWFLVAGDMDGDADTDLLTFGDLDRVTILENDGEGRFPGAASYGIGPGASRIAIGDMDKDADLDLAVMNTREPRDFLTVLFNRGDGSLAASRVFPLERQARWLVAGDFDGDALTDFAAADPAGFTILRAESPLEFGEKMRVATQDLRAIAALDADRDGDLDVAIGQTGGNRVAFYFGDGGSFGVGPEVSLGESTPVYDLSAGDFTADGGADLAVGSFHKMLILVRDADGEYAPAQELNSEYSTHRLAARDLDGDGDLDLAGVGVLDPMSNVLQVFLREPSGLEPKSPLPMGGSVVGFAPVEGSEGKSDLVATIQETSEALSLSNDGNGLFSIAWRSSSVEGPGSAIAANLDGDGLPDLVVTSEWTGTLFVFGGEGEGKFGVPHPLVAGYRPFPLAVLDLELDGKTDLVTANATSLSVFHNEGGQERTSIDCNADHVPDECELEAGDCDQNGALDACEVASAAAAFETLLTFPVGRDGEELDLGDLDGDGDYDFFASSPIDHRVKVFLNDENRGVVAGSDVLVSSPVDVVLADFDCDGDLDGAATSWDDATAGGGDGVRVLRNDGTGQLDPMPLHLVGDEPVSLASADFDGDSDIDLAVVSLNADGFAILYNEGNGIFTAGSVLQVGRRVAQVVAFDRDGDGDTDAAFLGLDARSLRVVRNSGNATFVADANYPLGVEPGGLAAADMDGDFDVDLVVAARENVLSLVNDGLGAFEAGVRAFHGDIFGPTSVAARDLDGDGDADLLVGGGTLKYFSNERPGVLSEAQRVGRSGNYASILAADFDFDGAQDAALFNHSGESVHVLRNLIRQGGKDCDHDGLPDACELDGNGNGIPDECELESPDPAPPFECRTSPRALFHRGDTNGDGLFDVSDGITVVKLLFEDGTPPPCTEAVDCDNNGKIETTDAIVVLGYLFLGTREPEAPGPVSMPCGTDPDAPGTTGDLGCAEYFPCDE
jgi:hypothetical protein